MKGKLYVCLFIFFILGFVLVSNGRYGGDGLENYLTAESIVLDGDAFIYDKAFDVPEMRYETRGKVVDSEKRVSAYGLGMALILVPFYFLGHLVSFLMPNLAHDYITQFTVSLVNPLILALLSLVLFRLLRQVGYSLRCSFWSVLIYSFCTMNIAYSRSGFSEPTVGLLVTLAALFLHKYSFKRSASSLIMAAAFIGYALFIKKNSFILFPAFGLYFLYLLIREKNSSIRLKVMHLACFMLPLILSLFAILIQNRLLYGGIFNTEFGSIGGMLLKVRTDGYPIKGLYYYLFSSGKGWFVYNIALVLGLFSLGDFFKKHKDYCLFILMLLVSNLFLYSFIFVRGSLFSWGPRYLFPTLPLAVLFIAEFISKNSHLLRRRLVIISFAILGFLIQLPGLIINFSKYLFFVKEKLNLPEYLINFMPELSPIKGSWALFLSMISRHISGFSLNFSYNPDYKFVNMVSASLEGYEMVDIWWMNVIKINSNLTPYVAMVLILVLGLLGLSLYRIIRYMKGPIYDQ
ncbi:MAG: glycosyltransferase family 39 protein [Candidatus Omnitrophica bacterium]|nr:glycosyltransferase family 39 protein [Candidatus Omnitrophota bacterium]